MSGERPLFSVVVPTYARPRQLRACLAALADQQYPRAAFEVVVVDDGSGAPPGSIVAGVADRIDARLLTPPHGGPARARNHGAAQARGRYLAFTDDDCAPAPGWLAALERVVAATPEQAIGGRTVNALAGNPYSVASQLLIDYLYGYYNAEPGKARFFASNNLALPTERFRELGGFDTSFPRAAGEDRELCDRWLQRGYRMTYAPEAVVYHAHRLSPRSFWRQHFTYGQAAFAFRQARARRDQAPVTVEPTRFYLELLRYPFVRGTGPSAPFLTTLLVVSQVANATGFWWARRAGGLG